MNSSDGESVMFVNSVSLEGPVEVNSSYLPLEIVMMK